MAPRTYSSEYAILLDRTAAEILRFARTHPRCFVFTFYTGAPEDAPDMWPLMQALRRNSDIYIVQPIAIGNLSPQESVIRQFIERGFGQFYADAICVHDDRKGHTP